MKRLYRPGLAFVAVVFCGLGSQCGLAADAKKAADGEIRQFLADHQTLAVFDGLQYNLCRGLTALCPKECGHSGEFAAFSIRKYLKYEKFGQYGDEKQTSYQVQVSDFNKKPKGDPKINQAVAALKKGDYVLLSWRHDYVTKDGTSSPERPIVKLEKIDKAKAEELLKQK